ncbi:F-box protein At4g19940-like [Bidens hawaiensis]|uniref:F-box protein At4g19940-like n=1 Tax=Bidens hawaiensis TaxID=980011 RepID=UPI00404990EC
MSHSIPLEIQLEIMKQLPVKSLIQFRSVSKTWKSIIDSSDFINKHYKVHHTKPQHLLVMYEDTLVRFSGQVDYKQKCVSIVDDHSFPKHKVSLKVPLLVKKLECPRVIGTSHGLVGLYSGTPGDGICRTDVVVIWNVSIRKAVAVFVPNVSIKTVIGFGVCRETKDPKIVKITYVVHTGIENLTCNSEVEVFTLSTGVWRRSYGGLPPHILFNCDIMNEVVTDGVIYWVAFGKITTNGNFTDVIISFDMTSEEFRVVTLPHGLKLVGISKLGESLVVYGQDECAVNLDYDVWVMCDGVSKLFTKLFTFTHIKGTSELGFRMSGKLIIETQEQGDDDRGQLAIYEPYSKHVDNLGIDGSLDSFAVCDYMETLLLLDQKDLMVYK